jgi:hypothetical protein
MSDMLEKLLGVEKKAAALVAEAEAEAGRRTAQVRMDCQKRHAELLKKQVAEGEAELAAARARIAAQRESRNRGENEKLESLRADQAAFRAAVISMMDSASK